MIQAVIFDMDGVISNTQKMHSPAESKTLDKFGIHVSPEEITRRYSGVKDTVWIADVLKQFRREDVAMESIVAEKWEQMGTDIAIAAIPGVIPFITSLYKNKFLLAVASASKTYFIHTVLDSLKIRDFFTVTMSAEKVPLGKPNPDLFLAVAKQLDVLPSNCLVIEDAPTGIEAARRADMKSIGITTTHTKEELKNATKIVNTFDELSIDDINNI